MGITSIIYFALLAICHHFQVQAAPEPRNAHHVSLPNIRRRQQQGTAATLAQPALPNGPRGTASFTVLLSCLSATVSLFALST